MLKTNSCMNIKDFNSDALKKNKSLNDLQKYSITIINDDDNWSMCYYFE